MPASKAFNFHEAVRSIINTTRGQERNMYAHVRNLFVYTLRHPSAAVVIDAAQQGTANRPDLAISAAVNITNNRSPDWIVAEVKDEKDALATVDKREKLFNDKAKYIKFGTEWFLMIDPTMLVARPIALRSQLKFDAAKDKIFYWQDFSNAEDFCQKLSFLSPEVDSPALHSFRQGDPSRIAVVKVDLPAKEKAKLNHAEQQRLQWAKNDFLDAISESTKMLQYACAQALAEWQPDINRMTAEVHKFDQRWGINLCFDPIKVEKATTTQFNGVEDRVAHDQQAKILAQKIKHHKAVAKLATRALPAYYRRSGQEDAVHKNHQPFTIESANLILARILLLRFFEDHHFFGDKKHLCNGGVDALQKMMKHFDRGYAVLLALAYHEGEKLYADAFDETDLDWVLASNHRQTSQAIETAMMYLSRFDFSTISGDILTGIYDRFLDAQQRKEMGEYYTPPSIARYIIARLAIRPHHSIFDPSCGSGTFLLAALHHMTNQDLLAGRGDYAQALATLRNIGGNDINPFSAVITRIQILWNLLSLKDDLKRQGFPALRIADGVNAIIKQEGFLKGRTADVYEYLDRHGHDFVIGNPPYIRPERSSDIDRLSAEFYAPIGGAQKNAYDLFVYKALQSWCKPLGKDGTAGRLGFVLPLSFCDSNNSKRLRELFNLGGQFRISEIVDLEAIAPLVFDAAVNPILLFAERRPACVDDKVIIRVAGHESVIDADLHEFDLTRAPHHTFSYKDVWTADGRILTKITPARKKIINKIARADGTLEDAVRVFWVGKNKRGKIIKWQDTSPRDIMNGDGVARWEKSHMLRMGGATRRQYQTARDDSGMDFYKGENISACLVEGAPVKANIIPASLSDSSLWKYRDLLPSVGFAFLGISLGYTAARFNPQEYAFFNTATLFFPNKKWERFPLDVALVSRIYQFYYASHLRMGTMSHSWRSRLYPGNLRLTPLPSALLKSTTKLNKLRDEFLRLCQNIHHRPHALLCLLEKVGGMTLTVACRAKNTHIKWSQSLLAGDQATINAPQLAAENGFYYLRLKANTTDSPWLAINNQNIANRLLAALTVYEGETLTRTDLLNILIPKNDKTRVAFLAGVKEYDNGGDHKKLEAVWGAIDNIVGAAFNLTAQNIRHIQKNMREDDFLRHIRPNLPYANRSRHGFLRGLDDPNRYGRAE